MSIRILPPSLRSSCHCGSNIDGGRRPYFGMMGMLYHNGEWGMGIVERGIGNCILNPHSPLQIPHSPFYCPVAETMINALAEDAKLPTAAPRRRQYSFLPPVLTS